MARVAIIVGHTKSPSFCDALAEAYRNGAVAAGHTVDVYATARLSFDPILHEGFAQVQPLEPDLETAHRAIMAADHLVIVFPLWLGDMPAILKGFLERVLQPEVLPGAQAGTFVTPLKGKSARIIVTMGMPALVYRWWFRPHAVEILKRNILGFVGVKPVRSTVIGSVETIGDAGRKAWLTQVEDLGRSVR
jgi:putative NADPH-quinone reductase